MLHRQQARAVVSARRMIVAGAVGMVEMALQRCRARRRGVGRGTQGGDGFQPPGGLLHGSRDATGGQHRHAVPVTAWTGGHRLGDERKSVLLRLDPSVHDALAGWAGDELRRTNAQIEFLLRRALADAGRMPGHAGRMRPRAAARPPPAQPKPASQPAGDDQAR